MSQPERIHLSLEAFAKHQSRRAILKSCGAVGVALSGISARSRDALALPSVSVAPPKIVRGEDCRATVSVVVTLAGIAHDVRYEVYGDLLESDEPDGEPDVCCALTPRVTITSHVARQSLELTALVMAADLGLVKGTGPASDETFSRDLVELFARIWLRDLTTALESGPWDSPIRVAVASTASAWTQPSQFPGNDLLVPRRGMPPQACAS